MTHWRKPSQPYPGYADDREFAALGFVLLFLSGVAALVGSSVIGMLVFFPA